MKKIILTVVATLAFPMLAQAIETTGNDLLRWCKDPNQYGRGQCLAFMTGAKEGWDTAMFLVKPPGLPFAGCPDSKVTNGQIRDVVVGFLERTPARRHEPAITLFVHAMREAFPCEARR